MYYSDALLNEFDTCQAVYGHTDRPIIGGGGITPNKISATCTPGVYGNARNNVRHILTLFSNNVVFVIEQMPVVIIFYVRRSLFVLLFGQ